MASSVDIMRTRPAVYASLLQGVIRAREQQWHCVPGFRAVARMYLEVAALVSRALREAREQRDDERRNGFVAGGERLLAGAQEQEAERQADLGH